MGATPQQLYLLERCIEYAISVSKLYQAKENFASAIRWGQHGIRHSVGFTQAYFVLFNVLKAADKLDEAAEVAKSIGHYRADDPQFIRGMIDLETKRGDKAATESWRAKLTNQWIAPRTIEGLLAKQRQEYRLPQTPPKEPPITEQSPRKSGLAGLLGSIGRRAAK